MTTITGTLLVGGGRSPYAASLLARMTVAPVAVTAVASGLLLPEPESITVAPDGTWTTDCLPLPDGYAYEFEAIIGGGAYVYTRTVVVPSTGTVRLQDLVDAVAPTAPYMAPPIWATDALAAAAAAALSETAAGMSATAAAGSLAALNASKGAANGVAPLDASSLLPEANVPTRLTEAVQSTTIESSGMIRGAAGKKYRTVSCAIRNSGAGFQLISDAGHAPLGVSGVTTDANNNIILAYDFVAKTVGSLVITPDETFSLLGYQIGASVGLTQATIEVGAPGIWSDYVFWDVPTLAFKSFNNLAASITPHTNATLAAAGHYLYLFNSQVSMIGPLYGGSMSSRTSTFNAHLESFGPAAGGAYGGFGFRFADAATRVTAAAQANGSNGHVDMKAWVMINSTIVRKVPVTEMVSTSGNFWIHGVFEVA